MVAHAENIELLDFLKRYLNMKKTCENCICSRLDYGFRTGWKYLYCMLDEPSFWYGGKKVSSNHVCKYWRNTK